MSDERVDAAIDEVAREMTRGELPPGFRALVIARIEPRDQRGDERWWARRSIRVLAPIAVAVAVVLGVLVVRAPWQGAPRGVDTAKRRTDVELEARRQPDPSSDPSSPALVLGSDQSADGRSRGLVIRLKPDPTHEGGTYEGGSRDGGTRDGGLASELMPDPIRIEALDAEAMQSIDVPPLSVDAMESIDVPRMEVPPLEVPGIGAE